MRDEEIAKLLASAAITDHRGGLSAFQALCDTDKIRAANVIVQVALRLAQSASLSVRLQAERLRSALRLVPIDNNTIDIVIDGARRLPPGLLNEFANAIPSAYRIRLATPSAPDKTATSLPPLTQPNTAPSTLTSATASSSQSSPTHHNEKDTPDARESEGGDCSVVLLLSRLDNQEANQHLLEGNGFKAIKYDNADKIIRDLDHNRDVCACVIDGSFFSGSDAEEQLDLFGRLGAYSTFIWVRIEDANLKVDHQKIRDRVRSIRMERVPLPAESLSIQASGTIRDSELQDIARARDWLRTDRGVRAEIDGLTERFARVFWASVRQYIYQQGGSSKLPVDVAKLRVFEAGQSSAMTALVRIGERQIVVKIDSRDNVLEEMGRFNTFVRDLDDRLFPAVFFHGGVGVLVFHLVESMGRPTQPAPMLHDHMERIWNDEAFATDGSFDATARLSDIKHALKNTAHHLSVLNKRSPPPSPYVGLDLCMSLFERLESRGIGWKVDPRAIRAREAAIRRYATLSAAATVHGDLHLRNVLIRGGRDAYPIDYRWTGPGHPAIDLVRLELALYTDFFRQLDHADICKEMQASLTRQARFDALVGWYPDLLRPAVNRACIYGCTVARDKAIEAVRVHGGTASDYVAAKYLVAWQRLLLTRTQTSLAMGIIEALTPLIESWKNEIPTSAGDESSGSPTAVAREPTGPSN